MENITLATFHELAKAEPLKRRLEASHIPAVIHDESAMERLWFVKQPLAGVRLKVRACDFETAQRLMQIWEETDGVLHHAVRCPECGSSRIEYPQFTRKFVLPNLVGLLSAIGLVEKEFYCQACHYTWPQEGTRHSKTRPHMAPYYFLEGIQQEHAEAHESANR
jgi:hypothetical protein